MGDGVRQADFINSLVKGRTASLVWAPPGCGKSRFALELARQVEKGRDGWQVVFVQHDDAAVRGELPELTRMERIVFVIDDAHECPDLVQLLAAACAAAPASASLHLLCLTRSTSRAPVLRILQSAFPAGAVREIDLGRPPAALVRNLIDQLLPKSSPLHRDTIARFVRQSFFPAVLICNLLRREAKLPQSFQRQDLRDRACREPLKQVFDGVCPIDAGTRALGVYAALTPVDRERADVRDLAAELSGVASDKVATLIERVLAAGLFQVNAQGLMRPSPDLLGDLVLEAACLDSQGRPTPYSKQLLERLLALDPIATVTNCADIGQLFGSDAHTDLVSGLLLASARTASVHNKREVMKLLRACLPIAARVPDIILQVAGILEKQGVLRRSPPAEDLAGNESIEMNVLALLMRASEVQPDIVPTALRLGRDLYSAALRDERSSEQVLAVLRASCSFKKGRAAAHARAVVNALHPWVSEPDLGAAALAALLSARFLELDSDPNGEGEQSEATSALEPTPPVWEVRDVAVNSIVHAITRPESTVQYAGLAALQGYAHSETPLDATLTEQWRPQLSRELEKLAKAVGAVPKATTSLPVWATAELRGWHWWVHSSDVLHNAGKATLSSIASTDAYQLWKALHSPSLPVTTLVPDDEKVPAESRAEHFKALGAADSAARAQQLFDALDARSSDNDSWRTLWRTVTDQVPAIPLDEQAGPIVSEFARRHPDAAWSLLNETDAQGPLFPVFPFLLDELGKQDPARRSEEARHVRAGTLLEDAWLRTLGTPQQLNEGERSLLARALRSAQVQTIYYSARALLNSTETSPVEVFDAVVGTIERHPADGALWELVFDRFAQWGGNLLPPVRDPPNESNTKVANNLIRLMRTYSSHLRWGFQPHTRQLDRVFGILAIATPERLQEWVRQQWGRLGTGASGWNDESPLNAGRLKSATALIRDSTSAAHWVDAYATWTKGPRPLAEIAARGLAELAPLDNPRVAQLATEIAANPTEASLQSFTELLGYRAAKPDFASQSLALLEMWSQHPIAYSTVEDAIVRSLVQQSGVRTFGLRALEAIAARRSAGDPSPLFSASLERAEREVRDAMGEPLA